MCKRREARRGFQVQGCRLTPSLDHSSGIPSSPDWVQTLGGSQAQSDYPHSQRWPRLRSRTPTRPSHKSLGQALQRTTEAAPLGFRQRDSCCWATRKCSHFASSGLGGGRARGRRTTMGSSKKHRGEKEVTGTTAAAGTGGATEQPARHREHKKHKHRSGGGGGSSGSERRKRSRERGSDRGSGRRGAEAEARSGTHGRERSQTEASERRVKREKRDDGYEAGEGRGLRHGVGVGGPGLAGPGCGGTPCPARQAVVPPGSLRQQLLKGLNAVI